MNPRLKTYVFAYMFRRNADTVWHETGKLCKWLQKETDFQSCPQNDRFALEKPWFHFKVLRFPTFWLPHSSASAENIVRVSKSRIKAKKKP